MGAVEPTSSVTTAGDLSTRTQIHDLVVDFYREIVFDDLLAPVFGEVAEVDWAVHIPKLIDYWCRVLLAQPGYVGTILHAHRHVHLKMRRFSAGSRAGTRGRARGTR